MSFGRLKLRRTDVLFSKYLRALRKKCERCGSIRSLQASHFYGRAKESVRYDLENIDCLCAGCHQYFTAYPAEYVAWKEKQLGKKAYDLLTLRAHTPKKRDDKLTLIIIKELQKSL